MQLLSYEVQRQKTLAQRQEDAFFVGIRRLNWLTACPEQEAIDELERFRSEFVSIFWDLAKHQMQLWKFREALSELLTLPLPKKFAERVRLYRDQIR